MIVPVLFQTQTPRVTLPMSSFTLQEEDLQEIVAKIASKTTEYEEGRAQMAEHKAQFERAEQEYRQHKERINAAAEEADVKKVEAGNIWPCVGWQWKSATQKLVVVLFCPATGGAEQDGSGGGEMQTSQEALRGQAQRPPGQHQEPGGKSGQQREAPSGPLFWTNNQKFIEYLPT